MSTDSKKIVHIVHNDKFTAGYINFMKLYYADYENAFIVNNKISNILSDEKDVFIINNHLFHLPQNIKNKLNEADLVVFSGFFNIKLILSLMKCGSNIINKTVVQFWGGDFYHFKGKSKNLKTIIKNFLKRNFLKKCKGFVFLINGEYEKFVELTGIEKKHFIAPMPNDPMVKIDYSVYRQNDRDAVINILVGNSGTKTNCHIDAFEMLKKYSNDDIKIFCPLSYGDKEYIEYVIGRGKEIFGEKFVPVTNFMNLEKYVKFLSTMQICLFNNDRQQGMGNINGSLGLGKKVYMRTDTSMYEYYLKKGYKIFPCEEIQNVDLNSFIFLDKNIQNNNIRLFDEMIANEYIDAKAKWDDVLSL